MANKSVWCLFGSGVWGRLAVVVCDGVWRFRWPWFVILRLQFVELLSSFSQCSLVVGVGRRVSDVGAREVWWHVGQLIGGAAAFSLMAWKGATGSSGMRCSMLRPVQNFYCAAARHAGRRAASENRA